MPFHSKKYFIILSRIVTSISHTKLWERLKISGSLAWVSDNHRKIKTEKENANSAFFIFIKNLKNDCEEQYLSNSFIFLIFLK